MSLSEIERDAGLTQPLPSGERILWQARPGARAMAASVFHLRWVTGYFGVAAIFVGIAAHRGGLSGGQSVAAATLLVPVAAAVIAILSVIGRMTARATVYTLTNRRIILHIGIAYEMTVSVPLSSITGAALRRGRGPRGDVALKVRDTGGTGYVALWPHVRPWRFWTPQPMLRALPDVEAAADLIGDALVAFNTGGRTRPAPAPMPIPAPAATPTRVAA